jgi:Na+-driven multidrug efflux pump
VQALTVLMNAVLAPVLIAGWGTGHPMGVAGAGLATTLALAAGVIAMSIYFARLEKYVRFAASQMRPRLATWARMINIGLPAGGEFVLLAVFAAVIYWIIRDFGAAAQAGFGLGNRITQSVFVPALAIAFAAAPIAGQNFGARHAGRVRETFRAAVISISAVMALITLFVQLAAPWLAAFFTDDRDVMAVAVQFLRVISWNFVAVGIVFVCSSLFQALGNTWPSLMSTGMRLVTFAAPAVWLSRQPGFELVHVWYLSVATTWLQVAVSLLLLRAQFGERLGAPSRSPAAP